MAIDFPLAMVARSIFHKWWMTSLASNCLRDSFAPNTAEAGSVYDRVRDPPRLFSVFA